MLISLIVYVLLSVFYDSSLWGWLWVILLIGPVVSSVIDVFYYKNIKKLNIVFIAIIV
jgi:drug/metabolite transporter (DMT)-like permease